MVKSYDMQSLIIGCEYLDSVVDKKGRILIPKKVRESAGISGGTVVKVRQRGRIVEVIPTAKKGRRTWRGALWG